MLTENDYIEINPTLPPAYTVIWLHGLGADGNDFAPVAHELALHHRLPSIRFVLPHAPWLPVTINNGYVMRAWYDIVSQDIDRHADREGIKKSCEQIRRLIENEKNRGIPTEKIMLAGFSQGAVIALNTALHCPGKLLGVLALSGYLPITADALQKIPGVDRTLPVFLGHGTQDDIVPVTLGEKAARVLTEAGYPVTWRSYAMAHSVCTDEIKDIGDWMRGIIMT